jgi:hypothetical protein
MFARLVHEGSESMNSHTGKGLVKWAAVVLVVAGAWATGYFQASRAALRAEYFEAGANISKNIEDLRRLRSATCVVPDADEALVSRIELQIGFLQGTYRLANASILEALSMAHDWYQMTQRTPSVQPVSQYVEGAASLGIKAPTIFPQNNEVSSQ